jgi:hypothetical protein
MAAFTMEDEEFAIESNHHPNRFVLQTFRNIAAFFPLTFNEMELADSIGCNNENTIIQVNGDKVHVGKGYERFIDPG